ncbi:type IVB secretion system protein IcmH/DotU [Neorhizobium huautlense]|uniref:type IVB secretion system protein IcmH/DotU n=1 Tax=Neorhizobium huautlense TaxID=67774 RepID=UPI000CFA10C7|nr:type IVB secretion system protein IcmH/DotU [Neorhizobium huautlense]
MFIEETVPIFQPLARLQSEDQLEDPLPPSPASTNSFQKTLVVHGHNPLVAAAAALLGLCAQLKSNVSYSDVEGLRLRVLQEIDAFERRITPLGMSSQAIKVCKYALCATIDDIILSTPWGSHSVWTTRSMVGSLFGDTLGGDRFFDLLTQLRKKPRANAELLELLYYCMRLGFEGRHRVTKRGAAELTLVCEDLHRLIRSVRGDFEPDLSLHWRGHCEDQKLRRKLPPIWIVVAIVAGVVLSIYMGLLFALNARADAVLNDLAKLPPNGTVRVVRSVPRPEVAMGGGRLRHFLEPEIREGLVTVEGDAQQLVVTIRAAGMFDSASPKVKNAFVPLLLRIGRSLNDEVGTVVLTGHTDAMPIQSLIFPSNHYLSLARAKAAGEIIKSMMNDPGRVREEGKGSAEPIAPNNTPDGRTQNRRIEIIIRKTR